jgi:hypothetical protein
VEASSDTKERKAAIQLRIAEQIENIAKALCEGKPAVAAERVLKALEAQLAREELRSKGSSS